MHILGLPFRFFNIRNIVDHPLIPEEILLPRICFCPIKNATTVGTVLITVIAMIAEKLVV